MVNVIRVGRKTRRKDGESFISMNVMILKYYGQWFNKWENRNIEYLIKFLVLWYTYTFPMLGEIGYAVSNSKTVEDVAEALYLLVAELVLVPKVFNLNYSRDIVLDLVKDLNNEEFAPKCLEHEEIFKKTLRTCRFFVASNIFISVPSILVACLIPLFEDERVLPTNLYYPWVDVLSTPAYEIFYLFTVTYKPIAASLYCCVELLPVGFMYYAVEQLEILAFDLENLHEMVNASAQEDNTTKKEFTLNAVKFCIRRHQFILNFVGKVETAFAAHFVIVFFATIVSICLAGVKIMAMESFLDNPVGWIWALAYLFIICYLVYAQAYAGNEIHIKIESFLTNSVRWIWALAYLFIICYLVYAQAYVGNEIYIKSQDLLIASFKTAVHADPEVKKLLLIFREKCQVPITVNAGPLCHVTLNSFTTLMQWSYKVYAVLNNSDAKTKYK